MTLIQERPIDVAAIIAAVKAETGLDDFGLPPIDVPLAMFANALNAEARLNANGVRARTATITRILTTRLRLQDRFARNSEIAREPIAGPVAIVGLARSGTTKVQRMMAANPLLQALPLWKLLDPIDDGAPDSAGRRIANAEAFVEVIKTSFPDFHAAHPMDALQADEEVFLMEMTLQNNTLMHGSHIPSYRAWLLDQPFDRWYRFLHRMLQFYQYQDRATGRPWLLKAPFHLGHLPELFAEFPDAVIVHCHRDPRSTIPSMCALFEASRRMASDDVDPVELGRVVMETWQGLMDAYMRDRPRFEATHRFIDVPYRSILKDAGAVMERIHAEAGLPIDEAARGAMRAWEIENDQHKHGKHSYTLERYGITPADIDRAFAAYTDRFADALAM